MKNERLRVLAAAVALGEFTYEELRAFTGANPHTVRSVLQREDVLEVVGVERGGRGRPPKRWAVRDRERIRAEVQQLEEAIGVLREDGAPADPEEDRLAAVLSAEDTLLRAWDPADEADREILTSTARLTIRDALPGDDRDDQISRRARGVALFARLADEAGRGRPQTPELLGEAAAALVELHQIAPERVPGFLRGLTDIAVRSGVAPPLAVLADHHPSEVLLGFSEGLDWIRQPVDGTALWIQRWSEPLLERGLVAGVVVPESLDRSVDDLVSWHVPKVVVGDSQDIDIVNRLSPRGAYFLSSSATVEEVASTLSRASDNVPASADLFGAERALDESRSPSRRLEGLASVSDGKELAHLMRLEAALLTILLRAEWLQDGMAAADLARELRIDVAKLASVVTDTLSGVVKEVGAGSDGDTRYRLRRRSGLILSLDIAPRHVRAARSDLRAELPSLDEAEEEGVILQEFDRFRPPADRVDEDVEAALDVAAHFCRTLLGDHSPEEVIGIGLAIAHPMDDRTGERHAGMGPRNDWDGRNPIQELEERLQWGRPIVPINDANAGLLAEVRYGAARGRENVWHVRWTAGIGAGGLVHGRLCTGSVGIAGEIGHLPVIRVQKHRRSPPPKCPTCNHFCLESVAGATAIARELGHEDVDLEMLLNDLMRPEWEQVARDAAFYVGQALAQITTLMNPELITIGGELDEVRLRPLMADIRRGIRDHALPPARDEVEVRPGERTGRAVLEGALVHVLEREAVPYLLSRAVGAVDSRTRSGRAMA